MSTDFIALFDRPGEGITPEWLLERVSSWPEVFEGFVERYGNFFRAKAWQVEELSVAGRGRSLVGPGGFVIDFDSGTIELWHGIRFSMFMSDTWHRNALRQVCMLIADLADSSRAIYTHELMPYSDYHSLAEIEAGLRAKIGPPAETFEELHAAEYFGPRAWYIDNFADLRLH